MGTNSRVLRRTDAPEQQSRPDGSDPSELQLLRTEIESLRRQNAVLRETLDTIEGSVVVYDQDRRYLLGNQTYHAIYPHLPRDSELIGRKYEAILAMSIEAGTVDNPDAYTNTRAFLAKRIADMEGRKTLPRETQNARPGRENYNPKTGRWFLVRSRRTLSGNDVSLRVDITAQKLLQRELQQAREAAEEASRMKSQFLSNISHELRTPLNAVINFARLITDQIHGPVGAPEYADYAHDIVDSGTHLLGLIDELLDLARAEAGRLTIAESVVDIGRLIATVCRVLRPGAATKGVRLIDETPAGLGNLRADATRLRQVLFNLIANAIKFTASGGSIVVSAKQAPEHDLRIVVRDDGIGIAQQDLQRVMEPFAQVAATPSGSQTGVGLGLPLSRHLIELHGGKLALHSTPGSGTTAVVTLPAARVLPLSSEGCGTGGD